MADEVKRKTGNQRQLVDSPRLKYNYVGGRHYFRGIHLVRVIADGRSQSNRIAHPDIAQRTKESIAMSGERYVPGLSWQCSFRDVADRTAKNVV